MSSIAVRRLNGEPGKRFSNAIFYENCQGTGNMSSLQGHRTEHPDLPKDVVGPNPIQIIYLPANTAAVLYSETNYGGNKLFFHNKGTNPDKLCLEKEAPGFHAKSIKFYESDDVQAAFSKLGTPSDEGSTGTTTWKIYGGSGGSKGPTTTPSPSPTPTTPIPTTPTTPTTTSDSNNTMYWISGGISISFIICCCLLILILFGYMMIKRKNDYSFR